MIFIDDVFYAWMKLRNYTLDGNKVLSDNTEIGELVFVKYYEGPKLKIIIKLKEKNG